MKKIGLAIALDDSATYHTQTFIEAIAYSLDNFPALNSYMYRTVSDQKSRSGGANSAKGLIDWGADIVIGHFSSIAAISAMPYYAAAHMPVILPAATSCQLDLLPANQQYLTYKYQNNNKALVQYCVFDCIAKRGSGNIIVIAQNNEYGKTLSRLIPLFRGVILTDTVPAHFGRSDTYVIFGYDDFARNIIKRLSSVPVYRIVLIDDSDCSDVHKALIVKPHRLSRVKAVFNIPKHGRPSPYWNETLLALALADSMLRTSNEKIAHLGTFETYLAPQSFDSNNRYDGNTLVTEDIYY
ncbi:ABC transporter substrate-binding protein [Pseudomonas huanghezhanensis]|uniref:ABC transporter substrate-binding protein n=1 Tax=Pseudomonas huanghezhanensis TaxID=3002903 RepID=UPI0022858B98|nr:ABC transporter substrate-binding protein [Pseudomonas sp. BSw22131]